mmetsp:Transcript_267/g.597  ORF Transcript_267/g.597 Transcript_267/m.597 type:complete len:235 (-) Transcript_267:253-957(-)
MDPLLWEEALPLIHILRYLRLVLHPGASSKVRLLGAVEERGNTLLRLPLLALHRLLLLLLPRDLLLPLLDLFLELLPHNRLVHEVAPLAGLLGRWNILALLLAILQLPPLRTLVVVPDGLALVGCGHGAFQGFLAFRHKAGRICSIPEVVEGQVLLVEGQRAHAHFLDMAELVVCVLLLEVNLAHRHWPLQGLVQGTDARVREKLLVRRVDGKVLHLVMSYQVHFWRGINGRQQ